MRVPIDLESSTTGSNRYWLSSFILLIYSHQIYTERQYICTLVPMYVLYYVYTIIPIICLESDLY